MTGKSTYWFVQVAASILLMSSFTCKRFSNSSWSNKLTRPHVEYSIDIWFILLFLIYFGRCTFVFVRRLCVHRHGLPVITILCKLWIGLRLLMLVFLAYNATNTCRHKHCWCLGDRCPLDSRARAAFWSTGCPVVSSTSHLTMPSQVQAISVIELIYSGGSRGANPAMNPPFSLGIDFGPSKENN